MAGQSGKKQVANNIRILQQTHILTGSIYAVSLFFRFFLHRPSNNKLFYLTSIPLFISLFILEKTGRPLIEPQTKKIIKEGQDLSQPGLVEYLFDVIYLTLALQLISVIFGSNLIWWVYLSVPGFAAYKLYNVFQAGKAMLGGGAAPAANSSSNASATSDDQAKSKRQQKREARGDKPKMRYR